MPSDVMSNPLYPLPPDYYQLTGEGKRLARVAACKRGDDPEDYVRKWMFFRNYYLSDLPIHLNLYTTGVVPSPPFHYQAVYDSARFPRNIYAAPRGTAKSTVLGVELPLMNFCALPGHNAAMLLGTNRLMADRFSIINKQCRENDRIIADFGMLVPPRGLGTWNMERMEGRNGSRIAGYCVGGTKRGGRFNFVWVDDPEKDVQTTTGAESAWDWLNTMLFRVMIPMLPPDGGLFWICTLLNSRSFGSFLMHSDDPRVANWNRVHLKARWDEYDETTKEITRKYLWPEIWGEAALKKREDEIGAAAFAAEYLNEPMAETERVFNIDDELHGYQVSDWDDDFPFSDRSKVKWKVIPRPNEVKPEDITKSPIELAYWKELPAHEVFGSMYKVITVDYAFTQDKRSDYSVVHVLGFDPTNTLWSLDLWMGKVKDSELLRLIYKYGSKWNVKVVGVENYSIQNRLLEAAKDYVADRSSAGWIPRVVEIKYPKSLSKAERIAAMEWRFSRYCVRLPAFRKGTWPYRELWSELSNFTLDMAMMTKDDAADTLAMSAEVAHVPGGQSRVIATGTGEEFRKRLESGQSFDKNGFPLFSGIGAQSIPAESLDKLLEILYTREDELRTARTRHAFRHTTVNG